MRNFFASKIFYFRKCVLSLQRVTEVTAAKDTKKCRGGQRKHGVKTV